MSESNDVFKTPEILDVTEVEKAKIHETGETQRKQIEEREKTTRDKLAAHTKKWTDSEFLQALMISLIVIIIFGSALGACYVTRRYPEPAASPVPSSCAETLRIYQAGDPAPMNCAPGTRMEQKTIDQFHTEIKCMCPRGDK